MASFKSPKASKSSSKNEAKGAKKIGEMKEAAKRRGGNSVKHSTKSLKNKNSKMSVEKIKALARTGNAEAIGHLASALKDKDPQVRKEAEKALEKIEESLKEDNEYDAQTDADVEEPLPSEGEAPAFAIDFQEQGSQGLGKEVEVDIRLKDVPEPLQCGGVWIAVDDTSKVSIVDVKAYDDNDLPGPWNSNLTNKVQDPGGPGTYLVTLKQDAAIEPTDGDIVICRVRLRHEGEGDTTIKVSTIPGVGTIGSKTNTYDPMMIPVKLEF